MLLGMACGFAISALWLTAETVLVEGKAEPVLMLGALTSCPSLWLLAGSGTGRFLGDLATSPSGQMDGLHNTRSRCSESTNDAWMSGRSTAISLVCFILSKERSCGSPYLDPPWSSAQADGRIVRSSGGPRTRNGDRGETDAEVEPLKNPN